MLTICVNGQPREVLEGLTVAMLLAEAGLSGKPVAVEVNRNLVPGRRHAECSLAEGDEVEIVTLVGGG